jgi:hypothetical protein
MNPATQMSEEQNRSQHTTEEGAGNVDKIRDILFGGQMRDYEVRFKRLEESLLRESAEIREMTQKRLESLEAHIKSEFQAYAERLQGERDERSKNLERQEKEMQELGANIRHELQTRAADLFQEVQTKHQESGASLDRHVAELKDAKADRTTIAALLQEMASRLAGDAAPVLKPPTTSKRG